MGLLFGFNSNGEVADLREQGLVPESTAVITRNGDGTVTETTTWSDGRTETTTYDPR
ncbi:hypothetical protein GCM10009654_33520 [Streptomyces hebeiensis]|uniref:YD repeat-containing protein n=1 Tax=Streptomyces hebeiensis TaxID=229486 RepID=A0ABP4FHZ5_9ACTN